ncbi:MAG: NADH:ubiquinone reductase (Na(+)-transporting) subunit C [Fluviicola sp.]|nr:NADH:ubiquinone reductase (Na(+)-transporting) subunit C [Fluviicola sp.]
MAINKDSNVYTIGFAVALVVVVGTILAMLSIGLKPMQKQNEVVKKKMDILSAMLTEMEMENISRKNASDEFDKYVDLSKAVVLDMNGELKDGKEAFEVDIRKERRDKNLAEADKNYPLFICEKEGKTMFVIPIVGNGLWGPIWGNISVGEDMRTILGASFGHKGETPGLGAEITQAFFVNRWLGEEISDENGEATKFEIVKNSSGSEPKKVDGITGGTITSVGVQEMVNRCLKPYVSYFNKLKSN